ncbi:MAG: deoxyribonuclease [Chloroflexi bacterium]|nr:deoxyribonuclease [Chloroflexota bacterium]
MQVETSTIPIPPLTRPLGRHIGTGPGMSQAIAQAKEIGCTAAQIFPGNPKGWRHTPLPPERATAGRLGWAEAGVAPLTIHAPYLINLASPDDNLYANSTQGVRNSLSRGVELGAPFVTVHLGSHKGTGPEAGAARLIAATHAALEGMPDWLYLLLENNVGAGNSMGNTLDALGNLVRDAAHPHIGVCIDTAHLWGAGYDLTTAEGVDRAVSEIDRAIGLQHVRVLHINDSPMGLDSHRDQHTYLGQGNIGYEGLAAVLTHPGLAGIPAILETPDGGPEEELIRLRTAALLSAGDAEGARAYQEAALPTGSDESGTVPGDDTDGSDSGTAALP